MRLQLVAITAVVLASVATDVSAQRPSYDRHFLDTTEYFIAETDMTGSYLYVAVARMVQAPSAATRGEGQFLVTGAGGGFRSGQRVWTRWFWRTRPATPAEATLGRAVFCLNRTDGELYVGPESREQSLDSGWWMTTVSDVSDLYREEVRAGEYRLSTGCLRVNADERAAAGPAAGPAAFDAHFLDSAEYFVSESPMTGSYLYVAVGRMIVPASETSRGAAQFLIVGGGGGLRVGQRVWLANFWRTRPANPQELAVGTRVFCLNNTEENAYRAPRERGEALNTGWWLTTITDMSDLYRQEVRAGEYRLRTNCLRVAR